ncbi:SusC/RagA family TonB-linked outer membrane protein [Confluentibacter sediminis]|uniref:SusC/RagA family TonB-linked outer membrane protein n=1 Tax=Confluentibacter sediminis TaxID=2219045 RepID=UPI001F491A39|nr:TonB-dependent receptor [Confluentibacter sediminis]
MTKFLFFKKEGIKYLGFLLLVFMFCTGMNAQTRVSGTVSDQNGPLPGVSVIVDGTSNGAATDFDGRYTLSNVASNATLVISYVGFVTQRIPVNGKTTIDVTLVEDLQALDEVVVVGYGTQSRATVTGAISNVKTEEIAAVPVANAVEALQGRAAGVLVINTGGPGTEPQVNIRGLGTFGNNAPLYVVDGVIVGNLSGISQNDIESINILKDASTTAVYGAQGSNGVVVVTTKKGKKGQTELSLNVFTGFQTQNKRYDLLNTQQYLQYAQEAYGVTITSPLSQSGIVTDWQDEIYQTGFIQNYDMAVSGGGEKSTFRFSGGYSEKEGIIIETGFEKFSFRANSDFDLGKLKIGQTMSVNFNKTKPEANSGGRSLLEHAIKMAPYLPVYNPDNIGGYQGPNNDDGGNDAENPVRIMEISTRNNRSFALVGNVFAEYEFIEGLKFKTQVGLDYFSTNNSTFTPSYSDGDKNKQDFASINKSSSFGQTLIFTNSLTYNKTIADMHNFELLLLAEKFENKFNNLNGSSQNPVSNEIDNIQSSDKQISATSSNNEYNRLGYLARLNYNYDNKYIASASIRRDASSRFGANNRWGTFYSASLGWNIAREAFMENSDFSTLKVRGSYGVSGNDKIANYSYAALLTSDFNYPFGNGNGSGTTPDALPNAALKWEQTKQLNIGLDVGLFNEKLTAALEYYINTSDDLLVRVPITPSLGVHAGSQVKNVGSVETKGFEINLGYNDYEGDFKWSANLNVGTSKNIAKSTGTAEFLQGGGFENDQITRIQVGEPLFYYYGLVSDGIYQTTAEVDAVFTAPAANISYRPLPGDVRYLDLNGDGNITEADKTNLGNSTPDFTYGVNFEASYKNWDFNIFINGVQGRDLVNTNIYDLQGMPRLFNSGVGVLDRWTPTNPSNTIPRAGIGGSATSGAPFNVRMSDRYLEDGSFARLKNLAIGYTLPKNAFGQDYFSKCRIYFSAQNLITITNYSGLDPEIANVGPDGSLFDSGIDRGAFPQPKTYLVGLQVTF